MPLTASSSHRDDLTSLLDHHLHKDLLRFTTAGSVDDGKSTLIGRLLHDSKAVYEDQLASVRKSRFNRSGGPLDFALLTDGLRAEREQGITIDVAYRYFETEKRKFIIADTPGHEQYTRNMATGASTADLAVILVDATRGLLAQTRRHAYIASLLGIPSIVAAINKMDLLGYAEDVFRRLQGEFEALTLQLGFSDVVSIPISALGGDNVVTRTSNMPWYAGSSLLQHLEAAPIRRAAVDEAVRMPVQYVIRPDATFRGFAGQIASGSLRPGDVVMALPSKKKSRVRSIVAREGDEAEAFAPMSVTLTLEDEIDLSRGDMLVSPNRLPHVSQHFEAMVVWFDEQPMAVGKTYLVKHAVRSSRVRSTGINYRVEMGALKQEPTHELRMNDIGAVRFEATSPLFFDLYATNRTTGSFILIDPLTNATVGAAMIHEALAAEESFSQALPGAAVENRERYRRHGHRPALVLAGDRTELAKRLERALFTQGCEVVRVSGGQFSADQIAAILRVAQTAGLIMIDSGGATAGVASPAGISVLDLESLRLPQEDEAAVEVILAALQPLRDLRQTEAEIN
jgi:bifunctional enzyme CysN/CysC/sulfate adenylyltransferase subunit 1